MRCFLEFMSSFQQRKYCGSKFREVNQIKNILNYPELWTDATKNM